MLFIVTAVLELHMGVNITSLSGILYLWQQLKGYIPIIMMIDDQYPHIEFLHLQPCTYVVAIDTHTLAMM